MLRIHLDQSSRRVSSITSLTPFSMHLHAFESLTSASLSCEKMSTNSRKAYQRPSASGIGLAVGQLVSLVPNYLRMLDLRLNERELLIHLVKISPGTTMIWLSLSRDWVSSNQVSPIS